MKKKKIIYEQPNNALIVPNETGDKIPKERFSKRKRTKCKVFKTSETTVN